MAGEKNSKYKDEYDALAYNYCLLGAKDTELAKFFDVSEQTINTWKSKHPSFLESLKKGKSVADGNVAISLYNRAIGFDYVETRDEHSEQGKKHVETTKKVVGDTTAQIFWLKNRQPSMWRDKQEVDNYVTIEAAKDDWDDV